jgi:hypothetical protein
MLPRLLLAILLGALLALPRAARAQQAVTVQREGVEIALWDLPGAPRAEQVAIWLAEQLAATLPAGSVARLEVERRGMERLFAVEGDRLLLHPRLPSASRDEQLQVLVTALWLLNEPHRRDEEAWARAIAQVEPLRPTGWAPRWWPRCCRGLDHLGPPASWPEPALEPADPGTWPLTGMAPPAATRAWGRADLYGGFRTPLASDWPWVVGTFGLYAPVERGELVVGLEAMPLGLAELRLGGGYAHLRRGILRLNAGPLVAWNIGSAMKAHRQQPGLPYPDHVQAGLWVDGEVGGFQGLLRLIPEEQLGWDGWFGWERRWRLSERWYLQPFGRARYSSEHLSERILSMGGSAGVRWMIVDDFLTHRTVAGRMEIEHVIPTGRFPGPSWLRPRAILLRAGADCGYSPEHDFKGGWAGSLGLALHPLREIKGVGWLTVAAPTRPDHLVWIVWLSTWLPQP